MNTLKIGSQRKDEVVLLQTFLHEAGYELAIDGIFGQQTKELVERFQKENALVVDGVVGQKTRAVLYKRFPSLLQKMHDKYLSEADLEDASKKYNLDIALIKAVNELESNGSGFILDKPRILFEGHVFYQRLKEHGVDPDPHQSKHPSIVYKSLTKKHYRGGLSEYLRLNTAMGIHETAALESASWGSFQVMGFNARSLRYESVQTFVEKMYRHEREHLDAFFRFIEVKDLIPLLREQKWAKFAEGYNGSKYKENNYDEKLRRAYLRFSA